MSLTIKQVDFSKEDAENAINFFQNKLLKNKEMAG